MCKWSFAILGAQFPFEAPTLMLIGTVLTLKGDHPPWVFNNWFIEDLNCIVNVTSFTYQDGFFNVSVISAAEQKEKMKVEKQILNNLRRHHDLNLALY